MKERVVWLQGFQTCNRILGSLLLIVGTEKLIISKLVLICKMGMMLISQVLVCFEYGLSEINIGESSRHDV